MPHAKHGPGEEGPGPGLPDPVRVQPAGQQGRRGQGKGDCPAGIAEEDERRVDQHRRMLQQRRQPVALHGRCQTRLHRVRAEHHHRHEESEVGA